MMQVQERRYKESGGLLVPSYGRSATGNFVILMSTATKVLTFSVHNLIKCSYISLYSV